ncbi:hypothetical protein, partial [Chthonobacter albigriseus]|uniref:hypothetical protein n=1 Tax=Chthonobacter albigriseus TaxID=1683161 RepID=UPI0015EFD8BE
MVAKADHGGAVVHVAAARHPITGPDGLTVVAAGTLLFARVAGLIVSCMTRLFARLALGPRRATFLHGFGGRLRRAGFSGGARRARFGGGARRTRGARLGGSP